MATSRVQPSVLVAPPTSAEVLERRKLQRQLLLLGACLCALLVLLGLVLWEMRGHDVIQRRDSLLVQSRFFSSEVPLLTVTGVQLIDTLPTGVRSVRSLHVGTVYHGRFTVGAARDTTEIFADAAVPPFIAVRTSTGTLILNETEPELTRARYAALAARFTAKLDSTSMPAKSRRARRTAR